MNKETNLEHYKEELKGIFSTDFYRPLVMTDKIKNLDKNFEREAGSIQFTDDILDWMAQPYREPILSGEEAEYLLQVIEPFRDMVESIYKCIRNKNNYVIRVDLKFDKSELYRKSIIFPLIEGKLMYRGMETDKAYSLEELGL